MKNTMYMLITITTVLVSWLFMSVFIAFFAEIDYVSAMRHNGHVFFALFIYWFPAVLVCQDYEKLMKK